MSSCQIPCRIFRVADRFAVRSVKKYLTNGNKCINSLSYLQYIFPRLINNRPKSINEVLKQRIRTPQPNTFVSARSSSSPTPPRARRGHGSANQVRAGAWPSHKFDNRRFRLVLRRLQTLVPHNRNYHLFCCFFFFKSYNFLCSCSYTEIHKINVNT